MKRVFVILIAYILFVSVIVGCGVLRKASKAKQEETIAAIDATNVNQEYVDSISLYYDDGPFTFGPRITVGQTCWVYTIRKTTTYPEGVDVTDTYTYYIPKGDSTVMYRSNKFSGKGYHGGHMVILKESCDTSYDNLSEKYFNGGRLARNKKDDPIAVAFEQYVNSLKP